MNTQAEGKRTVLVAVTGGIAAYKTCELVRLFQKEDWRVKVLMSEHATKFVTPTTFRALTREPVAIGLFDDAPGDPIHHISLAQEADLVVVAPATANIIAKMATGIADDLISTTLLATDAPILVAPAMNNGMWNATATQANVATLLKRGVRTVGPSNGYLACGDTANGRMSEPEEIFRAALDIAESGDLLAGKRIVITAGPTHEPIDPVRYIGNRSSGKMGIALAEAALAQGAQVTLVLGPTHLNAPAKAHVVNVETAQEMHDAALDAFDGADAAICAAAVADYTPASAADHKLKKAKEPLDAIELKETADILAELSQNKSGRVVVGFAAETDNLLEHAATKLVRKGCDAIVANDVSRADSGFGTDTDKAWWLCEGSIEELPTMEKRALAAETITRLAALLKD